MHLPDYWLTRPQVPRSPEAHQAFDALLNTVRSTLGDPEIPYTLPWPKWQFLCYLAEQHGLALHGSGNPAIALFEPRQANDLNPFGAQKAVYAAADGLWAMFFAIVDRDNFAMSVTNACVRLVSPTGDLTAPYYFFSVSQTVRPQQPWRTGTVYLLPNATFVAHPSLSFGPYQVQVAQLASRTAVSPLAKLTVTPADFPFLAQIRGHDDQRLQEYATALQTGAPLPD